MDTNTLIGIFIPFAGTTLGAAMVFFMRKGMNEALQKLLLGFASGVMTVSYTHLDGRLKQAAWTCAGHESDRRRQAGDRSRYSNDRIVWILHDAAFHDRRQRNL